ncbi:N-succinylarginine dihydrolase [Ferrimonas lipolytica]|uniref:N-succinylarginine dihydrolase n=1 Tax=Ferrimonas lipolytica TaxID=2724191 RepID=A0A6H1UDK3_9GAMM|nr:N-succinylarginine dihydrolase [Ferrimonas lipolytica]QIZ75882.1 N-succinylarginine dihydrolase [Ferrimonas lipolytica]
MHLEANFDGLVGPTHNYAGLSVGNLASQNHAKASSNPKAAALQGLDKMLALHNLGMVQGVLAPQSRPDITTLRQLGFSGSNAQVIEKAFTQAPHLLTACYSASSMWSANAATVSPSADSQDGKVHFTPANLVNKLHRAIEHEQTGRTLAAVFNDDSHFTHHRALPSHDALGDEGAANHTRLCSSYGEQGLQLFVYGKSAYDQTKPQPQRFPARQTLEASQAIARSHQLNPENTIFIQQNPEVIDQGVFHNDVIAVGNHNLLLCHQQAFLDQPNALEQIKAKFGNSPLYIVEVKTDEVSIEQAVKSYLFNTQILTLPNGEMALIAPTECQQQPQVAAFLAELPQRNQPINHVHFYDVKQSMQNGGGPACLRLRVNLSAQELAAVNPDCLINQNKHRQLSGWVERHYRDQLSFNDLRDVALLDQSQTALDELTQLLGLGSIYPFQR